MTPLRALNVLFILRLSLASIVPDQHPLLANLHTNHIPGTSPGADDVRAHTTTPRMLQGRFLHITDMHPDPYYQYNASVSSSCHRIDEIGFENENMKKKKKKKMTRAGYWGTPYSSCDSPFRLINFTLDFLAEEWADEIDFVIWTGDSARHDNDPMIPRSFEEISDLNGALARKMEDVFLTRGIPVVPSIGNNDVSPHNTMSAGPNSITREYSSIWDSFIPSVHQPTFRRGAYFAADVIPNAVAVISLNTMYFYDHNEAVRGCAHHERSDPGNSELEWLEAELKRFRARGMQVWMIGHVPPSPRTYFPKCIARYTELSLRFQDTILGHLFGHLNVDLFYFLDAEHVKRQNQAVSKTTLYESVLKTFSDLPEDMDDSDYDDYAIINVSPSVVPNPYLPSFRVYSYNVSGTDVGEAWEGAGDCRRNHKQGPSRRNQLWTPLGYAQYFLRGLGAAKGDEADFKAPKYELEYFTYAVSALGASGPDGDGGGDRVPLRHLPEEEELGRYAPYGLADLTIASWLRLARRVAESSRLQKRFKEIMYMEGIDE